MECKIIEKKKNPLLQREEIVATCTNLTTPSKKDVTQALAQQLSVPEDAISVQKISSRFGEKNFTIRANAYASAEQKTKTEVRKKKKKKEQKK